MLVILSPAKTMDMSVVEQELPGTTPKYAAEAEYLAEQMRHFSAANLEKLLKISPKLAEENYNRIPTVRVSFKSSETGFTGL